MLAGYETINGYDIEVVPETTTDETKCYRAEIRGRFGGLVWPSPRFDSPGPAIEYAKQIAGTLPAVSDCYGCEGCE